MPAKRLRTLEWRRCLKQVCERHGSLEMAISPQEKGGAGTNLVWRVRLLETTDRELSVEHPSALGEFMPIETGINVVVMFSVGQNRWTFATRVTRFEVRHGGPGKSCELRILHLAMPQSVQRCQRRVYDRFEIDDAVRADNELKLPQVEIWPLLDPKSVLVAERAGELRDQGTPGSPNQMPGGGSELNMPEVGPRFTATLVNLGGGGVGLRVHPNNSQNIARHKVFWIRLTLEPGVSEPICATCKIVHTHMESSHHIYAGVAFDFSFNPGHQRFVVEQICRYVAKLQQPAPSASAIAGEAA